jgi:Xaa-Pro dipeptidase
MLITSGPKTSTSTPDLDFSPEEYEQRLDKVRAEMRARNLDALLVDQHEHLVYLFAYLPTAARYQAAVLPVDAPPHLVVRGVDEVGFLSSSWVRSYTSYRDGEDPVEIAAREIERIGARRVGVEKDSHMFLVERFEQLRDRLPNVELLDFSRFLWELRLIKSAAEIDYLQKAAVIADAALRAGIEAAHEGLTEREPAAAVYTKAIQLGADNGRVALFAYGATSGAIHGRLGTRTLERGQILHLEVVPQVKGYSARTMRPVVIGEATDQQRHLAERLVAIQDAQLAAMKPGAIASDLDRMVRERVLAEKLRPEYPSTTGYTLGYHATPRTSDQTRVFQPDADYPLEPGMVFHMLILGGGMGFSETMLVTPTGAERMTHLDRRLFVS